LNINKKYVYIGDLSKKDSKIIQYYAKKAKNVLEFGVGGSSQIFAQCCDFNSKIVCVDTCKEWIESTQLVLSEIEKDRPIAKIKFVQYDSFLNDKKENYDVIFNDGLGRKRLEFALQTWSNLKSDGGVLIFHDTRREKDCKCMCEIITKFYNEIDLIEMNKDDSNISIITKKPLQEYEDWNVTEKKEDWMKNARNKNRPKNWTSIMRDKIHKQKD